MRIHRLSSIVSCAALTVLWLNTSPACALPIGGAVYHLDASNVDGANNATLTEGAAVGVWNEQIASNHAMPGATSPIYQSTAANGLPAVRFVTNSDQLVSPAETTWGSVFVVTRTDASSPSLSGLLGDNNSDFGIRRNSSIATYRGANTGATNGGDFTRSGGSFFVNGARTDTAALGSLHLVSAMAGVPGPLGSIAPQIGGYGGRDHIGDYAEIVIYDRTLNWKERHAVEGYLGAKYNLAITPTIDESLVNTVQINTNSNLPVFEHQEVRAAVNFHQNGAANAVLAGATILGQAFNDVNVNAANVTNLTLSSGVKLTTNFSFFNGLREQAVPVLGTDATAAAQLLRQIHAIGTTDTASITLSGLTPNASLFVQLFGGDAGWGADLAITAQGDSEGIWTMVADSNGGTGSLYGFFTSADATGTLQFSLQALNVGGPGNGNYAGLAGFMVTEQVPEPSTLLLLGLGALLVAPRVRHWRKR